MVDIKTKIEEKVKPKVEELLKIWPMLKLVEGFSTIDVKWLNSPVLIKRKVKMLSKDYLILIGVTCLVVTLTTVVKLVNNATDEKRVSTLPFL